VQEHRRRPSGASITNRCAIHLLELRHSAFVMSGHSDWRWSIAVAYWSQMWLIGDAYGAALLSRDLMCARHHLLVNTCTCTVPPRSLTGAGSIPGCYAARITE